MFFHKRLNGVWINQVYGYPYPNKILDTLYIYNPYKLANQPATALVAVDGATWKMAEFYQWSNDSEPTNQCKYSFYGYIRHTEQGMIVLVKDGTESPLDGNSVPEVNHLPLYVIFYLILMRLSNASRCIQELLWLNNL